MARSGGIAYRAELPVGTGGAPTVVEDTLFVPAVDGSIYLLTARSGAGAARKTPYKVDHPLAGSPCVTESLVVVGSADGLIYALDRASGAVKWIYRCRAPDQLPSEGSTYGVYSPLLAADGALFAMTGAGDLYRFSASAPDAAGPEFGDFQPEGGSAMPGGGYVGISFSVADDGSGVDGASIKATIDGSAVKITFDPVTGEVASLAAPLPDGAHLVKVSAADYRGNESSTEWSFVTDASLIPVQQQPGVPGQRGAIGQQGTRRAPGGQTGQGTRGVPGGGY